MKAKNVLSLVMVVFIAAAILAGCGGPASEVTPPKTEETKTPPEQKPVTVTWYTPNWDEPESREMVKEFEAKNSDVKVELVITEWATYKEKAVAALSGNNAPELYTILLTDASPFSKMDMLEPLNDLGTNAGMDWDDFLEAALEVTSVNGNIYCAPFRYDGSGVFYNVDMLSEAGYEAFPKTWDQVLKMSDKLLSKGYTPTAWYLGEQSNACVALVIQLYTEGADILNADETKCVLNTAEAKKALSNIVETIKKGYASSSSLEMDNSATRDAFGAGSLAFVYSGPYDVDTLKNDYPKLNFATAVLPGVDGMGYTQANGWGVAMGAHSKNKEAAAKFLTYIMTPENQVRLTDSFPASKKASKFEKYSDKLLAPFITQLENSKREPSYNRWLEIQPIIYNYIQSAVSGTMTADEACEAMTKEINALLAS